MSPKKQWNINTAGDGHEREIAVMAETLGIRIPTATLLWNRGYTTAEEAEQFLKKETVMFHDPFLMPGMDIACERIEAAIDRGEKIVIYGDYDVDGVTSVSILCLYLRARGAKVDYYIPNRIGEGYGMNRNALDRIAAEGASLMITVDTGITAVEEIEYATSLGIDVLVTDHHECHDVLPNAAAVINPRRPDSSYPFKELAGVGVVFKLLSALEFRASRQAGEEGYAYMRRLCEEYADLVAIGTVADVMPLVDENRLIVSVGLSLIERTKRKGLAALIDQSLAGSDPKGGKTAKKKKITSSFIGYTIAPRINAAGRISSAARAVELFMTDSEAEAYAISEDLCNTNRQRQIEENAIIAQANAKIREELDFEHDKIIVLAEDNWHHGVIGIVSSRITEKYNLPSILISFEGDIGKGSGRSIKGINLVEALKACGDLLVKFGGHELAAGLSVERDKLPALRERLNEYVSTHLADAEVVTNIDIDARIGISDITIEQVSELYLLEPYGIANPVPVFALCDVQVAEITPIGAGKHTKMLLECGGKYVTALFFGKNPAELGIVSGDTVDAAFNLDINDFQNQRTVQLLVRDIRLAADIRQTLAADREAYERIKEAIRTGDRCTLDEATVPVREDFAGVYLYLKQLARQNLDTVSIRAMQRYFAASGISRSAVKLMLCIDIFNETNVVGIEPLHADSHSDLPSDCYRFKLNFVKTKVNLEKSSIYKRLKACREIK